MKKYVMVGAGSRATSMYAANIQQHFQDCARLTGVYDPNGKRAAAMVAIAGLKDCTVYQDFDAMLAAEKPDTVLVVSMDCTHHTYIIRALEAGCDVISEKPLTVDENKYAQIAEAERRTGRKVTVTFNCRFMPFFARVKELVSSGAVGDILSVHYEWYLDTSHGADYFRRWHRRRENSGSLLVHKSTHHFDIANWLLEQEPQAVNAFGSRRFYGSKPERRSQRCLTCPDKGSCAFYLDIQANDQLRRLYYETEDADGYFRDRCVFSDEIDIEDSVSLNVRYSGGTVMSYSLTAHSPYEGYRLVLNGVKGRLIAEHQTGIGYYQGRETYHLAVYNRRGERVDYGQPNTFVDAAGHNGGDIRLLEMLLRGYSEDPLGQIADSRAGAMSIMIGIAANRSMKEGRQVQISELMPEGLR